MVIVFSDVSLFVFVVGNHTTEEQNKFRKLYNKVFILLTTDNEVICCDIGKSLMIFLF